MGEFFVTHCRNCDADEHFTIGVGMMYASLQEVIPITKGKTRHALQDIIDHHQVVDSEYAHRLLSCPKCDTLHERFYVRVNYDDGKLHETIFRCGKCRTLLVEPSKPVSEHHCGKCGSRTLEEGPMGLWD